jgi:hypothetical protein
MPHVYLEDVAARVAGRTISRVLTGFVATFFHCGNGQMRWFASILREYRTINESLHRKAKHSPDALCFFIAYFKGKKFEFIVYS